MRLILGFGERVFCRVFVRVRRVVYVYPPPGEGESCENPHYTRTQPRIPESVPPRPAGHVFPSLAPHALDELKAHHISQVVLYAAKRGARGAPAWELLRK